MNAQYLLDTARQLRQPDPAAASEFETSRDGLAEPLGAAPSHVQGELTVDTAVRILVVDDDPDIVRGAARVLQRESYTTKMAETGEEALKVISSFRPDLVLLDRDLPGLDGVQVCRRIKQTPGASHTFVVMISGTYTGSGEQAEGLEAGADGYIVRPISNRELAARINAYVRNLELMNALRYERRKVEEQNAALAESEERFRATFEQAAVGIAHVGTDGRWLRANQRLCEIVGYPCEELLQLTFQDITHPDDLYADLTQVQRMLAGEIESYAMEKRYLRKDASAVWINLTVSLLREPSGEPKHFIAVIEDIARRKQAELALAEYRQRLDLVIKGSQDAPWDWDLLSNELYYSPQWWGQLGYAPDELPADAALWESLLHPDDRVRVDEVFRNALQGGFDSYEVEVRLQHKDGQYVPVLSRGFITRTADGQPARVTGTNMDLTERKRAEQTQRELEGQLRQTQKLEALGTLAGGIAHDFNNILGAILGYSELLKSRMAPGSEDEEDIDQVLQGAFRAKELVKQILTFSRKTEASRQPVQVHLVLGEALRLLRQTIPTTIAIRQDISKERDTVSADTTQILQVVMNLATNAYHALRDDSGQILISLQPVDADAALCARVPGLSEGPWVRLGVADDGEGMAPETVERIFEPFFTTKPVGEGTGMGLAVVHGIVAGHGGAITIDSRPGQGTRVEVYLPCHGAAQPAAAPPPAPLPRGCERVLVVDDEPALVKIMQKALQQLGYQVTTSVSGPQALERFRSDPAAFDLVLTDQTMPELSGVRLTQQLLELRPELPVILCTGYSATLDEAGARKAGARALLPKPLTKQQLARLVRAVLDGEAP